MTYETIGRDDTGCGHAHRTPRDEERDATCPDCGHYRFCTGDVSHYSWCDALPQNMEKRKREESEERGEEQPTCSHCGGDGMGGDEGTATLCAWCAE